MTLFAANEDRKCDPDYSDAEREDKVQRGGLAENRTSAGDVLRQAVRR